MPRNTEHMKIDLRMYCGLIALGKAMRGQQFAAEDIVDEAVDLVANISIKTDAYETDK